MPELEVPRSNEQPRLLEMGPGAARRGPYRNAPTLGKSRKQFDDSCQREMFPIKFRTILLARHRVEHSDCRRRMG
jgi:hypothetical protein